MIRRAIDALPPTVRPRVDDALTRWSPVSLHQLRGLAPLDIDLDRARLIRQANPEALLDPHWLECGLLPALGFSDEIPDLFPTELQPFVGRGLRSWQYPNQFAPYLLELSRRPIRSYLEIGVQSGGTFVITVEFLDRFHPLDRAVALDLFRAPGLKRYARQKPAARFLAVDTQLERFRDFVDRSGWFDLVMIDGDHSREGCQRDFDVVREHAGAVVFHDIVNSLTPGVTEVWERIREEHADTYDFHEFTDQYPEVERRTGRTFNGIGLALRKSTG